MAGFNATKRYNEVNDAEKLTNMFYVDYFRKHGVAVPERDRKTILKRWQRFLKQRSGTTKSGLGSVAEKTYSDTWKNRNIDTKHYRERIHSAEWLDVKAKAKQFKKLKSCYCCKSTVALDIHHLSYKRMGTDEEILDLVACCRTCHSKIHDVASVLGCSVHYATLIVKKYKEFLLKP